MRAIVGGERRLGEMLIVIENGTSFRESSLSMMNTTLGSIPPEFTYQQSTE